MRMTVPLFLLIFLLMACTRDVDIEQPRYQQRIVVDGYIETGRPAYVFLTMSSPYLTRYDSVSIRQSFLNYGKITLSSSKGEEEVLTLFREKGFFPPFVYRSIEMEGETGVRYDIKVEVKGREVTASTTIPPAPDIHSVRFIATTDTTGYSEFSVMPPRSGKRFLFTRVRSTLAEEGYHPALNPVTIVSSDDKSPSWKRVLRSSEFGYYLMEPDSVYYNNSYPRYEYDLRDTVQILVGSVDSISYKVLESLLMDRANMENPFVFSGNKIESNIEGGIGRWTGIGVTRPLSLTRESAMKQEE